MNPITWIKTNAELAAAIGAALFFVICSGALGVQLIGAHATIKADAAAYGALNQAHVKTVADLATCRGNTAGLQAALSSQNDAVAALKAQGDAKARAADQAIQAARQQAAGYRASAAQILAAQPVGDRCTAAADLLRTTLGADR